jgi:hypothetical protein
MVSSKILWSSVISTKDVCFAGADIINMYLETPLGQCEYMKMPIALFSINKLNISPSTKKTSMDIYLRGNTKRNVRTTTGWYPSQQTTQKMAISSWVF